MSTLGNTLNDIAMTLRSQMTRARAAWGLALKKAGFPARAEGEASREGAVAGKAAEIGRPAQKKMGASTPHPPWSKEQEQQAREAVLEAVRKLSPQRGEHALIKALAVLSSRDPVGRGVDWHWINTERDTPVLRGPLIAQVAAIGNVAALDALLQWGGNPNAMDRMGRCPIWYVLENVRTLVLQPAMVVVERDSSQSRPGSASVNTTVVHIPSALGGGKAPTATRNEAFDQADRIIRRLLVAGASANGIGTGIDRRDRRPILFDAAELASEQLTKTLLEFGADAQTPSHDQEPILCALVASSADCVRLFEPLIQAGARLEDCDNNGDTPLLVAARWHCTQAAQELIRLGAREDAVSAEGLMWKALARQSNPLTDASSQGRVSRQKFMAMIERRELQEAMRSPSEGTEGVPNSMPCDGVPPSDVVVRHSPARRL